jgi:hypothetical protein
VLLNFSYSIHRNKVIFDFLLSRFLSFQDILLNFKFSKTHFNLTIKLSLQLYQFVSFSFTMPDYRDIYCLTNVTQQMLDL